MDLQKLLEIADQIIVLRGGATSGNWGHSGRPGKKGGSGQGGGFGRIGIKDGKAGRGKVKQASRQTRAKAARPTGGKKESETVKEKIKERLRTTATRDIGVISQSGDRLHLSTPYNPGFVNDLKSKISGPNRTWDNNRKIWIVNASKREDAEDIMSKHFNTIDQDKVGAKGVKRAKQRVQMAQIKTNQSLIKDNRGVFEDGIKNAQADIDYYSGSSGSQRRRRSDAMRRRDLLEYALRDSKRPVTAIKESIQIRGMSAALREMGIEGRF